MITTAGRLPGDECALDCDHDLPPQVFIYNTEDLAWVGRANARVVCTAAEIDQLTDRLTREPSQW